MQTILLVSSDVYDSERTIGQDYYCGDDDDDATYDATRDVSGGGRMTVVTTNAVSGATAGVGVGATSPDDAAAAAAVVKLTGLATRETDEYRCCCGLFAARTAAGFVLLLECCWIVYQLIKNVVMYAERPQRHAETFFASFLVSSSALLAVAVSCSAVFCRSSSRLIPYLLLSLLSISALIAGSLVSIIKLAFGHVHPALASMANSVAPSFELLSFYDRDDDDPERRGVGGGGGIATPNDDQKTATLLIIFLSGALAVLKIWFFIAVLTYYQFLKDVRVSGVKR